MTDKNIKVIGGVMSAGEMNYYWDYIEEKHHRKLQSLEIKIDNDDVELSYHFVPVSFERIRRITGYLTGSKDSWNNAKKAEENDRVKHSTEIEQI